jgi:hypothetical protein
MRTTLCFWKLAPKLKSKEKCLVTQQSEEIRARIFPNSRLRGAANLWVCHAGRGKILPSTYQDPG